MDYDRINEPTRQKEGSRTRARASLVAISTVRQSLVRVVRVFDWQSRSRAVEGSKKDCWIKRVFDRQGTGRRLTLQRLESLRGVDAR